MKISVSIDRTSAIAKQPFKFQVVYANVDNPNLVEAQVFDPQNNLIPVQNTVRAHGR